jgi:two-component system sensor histidine kinase BaeS
LKRSMESATGSRPRRRISLEIKLFLTIFGVTLVCILAFALLSNYLVHKEFEQSFRGNEFAFQPPPDMPVVIPPDVEAARSQRLRDINISYMITGLLGILLASILSYYLSSRISKPLSELTSATRDIAGGEYGKQVVVVGGRELEELGDAFNALSHGLERNEILRKNMVADISHELRNPLAAQRGYLEALEDGVIDLNQEAVGIIMKHNVSLTRMVEDLRQLSLVDAGQVDLDLMKVEVEETLRLAASGFEHDLDEKGISLGMDIATNPPAVRADLGRILQVLNNLIANALAYTPPGGTITLGAIRQAEEVVFSVSDTGQGLDAEELSNIFERFYRTDRSRARDTGGSGLGLSIAKGLVEAHGGRMWAESDFGRGTTIFFTLPIFTPQLD